MRCVVVGFDWSSSRLAIRARTSEIDFDDFRVAVTPLTFYLTHTIRTLQIDCCRRSPSWNGEMSLCASGRNKSTDNQHTKNEKRFHLVSPRIAAARAAAPTFAMSSSSCGV